MMRLRLFLFFIHVIAATAWLNATGGQVSIYSLLEEMIDRESVARWPSPWYTCHQVSSRDPLSVSPDSANWYANSDRNNFLRCEYNNGRKEYVLMDDTGPGAIVRFWATVARYSGKGVLRVYIDNDVAPQLEGDILHILSGDHFIPKGMLNQSLAAGSDYLKRGHNLYYPIPYQLSCKITFESDSLKGAGINTGEILYYNINYRKYPDGTAVESFTKHAVARYSTQLGQVEQKLSAYDRRMEKQLHPDTAVFSAKELEPGSVFRHIIEREGAIRMLKVKLNDNNINQALRSTILRISFDEKETVYAPIGNFFGTGHQLNPYKSWYTEVREEGTLCSYWVMPFKTSVEITIENTGDHSTMIDTLEIITDSLQWDHRSLYFTCSWYACHLPTRKYSIPDGKEQPFDQPILSIKGRGVFVGDGVALYNTANQWWGEGDEKIYIDGDTFPTHFGTGTEDYYGYAWCMGTPFYHPFLAQPTGEGATTPGHVVNLRYRSLDAIPFKKDFRFDMEIWHWSKTEIDYAPIAYGYVFPGSILEDLN